MPVKSHAREITTNYSEMEVCHRNIASADKRKNVFQFKLFNPTTMKGKKRIYIKSNSLIKEDTEPTTILSVLCGNNLTAMCGEVFCKNIPAGVSEKIIKILKYLIPNKEKRTVIKNYDYYELILPSCVLLTSIDDYDKQDIELNVSLIGYDQESIKGKTKLAYYHTGPNSYIFNVNEKFQPLTIFGDEKIVKAIKEFPSRDFKILIPRV